MDGFTDGYKKYYRRLKLSIAKSMARDRINRRRRIMKNTSWMNEDNYIYRNGYPGISKLESDPILASIWNYFEIINFNKIYEERKERMDSTKIDEQEANEKKDRIVLWEIFTDFYGPFSIVLSFIDPLELLFNFIFVNKNFHESIFFGFSNGVYKLNDNHLYIMLGRNKRHICEKFFLKLASLEIFDEKTLIHLRLPVFCYYEYWKLNVIQICVLRGFLNGLKYLTHERGMQNFHTTDKSFREKYGDGRSIGIRFKYLAVASVDFRVEILRFLIDNFDTKIFSFFDKNSDSFNSLEIVTSRLLLRSDKPNEDWKRFIKIVKDHPVESLSGAEIISRFFSLACKKIEQKYHLEKWKEIENCFITEGLNESFYRNFRYTVTQLRFTKPLSKELLKYIKERTIEYKFQDDDSDPEFEEWEESEEEEEEEEEGEEISSVDRIYRDFHKEGIDNYFKKNENKSDQ